VGIFYGTEKHALTCSTFCLVGVGGRSSMNLMVSVGVSLVVSSMTLTASFYEQQIVFLSAALSLLEATAGENSLVSRKAFMRQHSTDEESCSGYQPTVVFQEMKKRASSPNLEPKEDRKTTVSPSKKRRPSSEQICVTSPRGMTSTSLTGGNRLWS